MGRRAVEVLVIAGVLALAETVAAAVAGVDEPAFFPVQAAATLVLGAALFLVPVPTRWLVVVAPLVLGAGHLLQAASSGGRMLGLLAWLAVALHAGVLGGGLVWLLRIARGEPAAGAQARGLAVGAAALLAQSLACGALLVGSLQAPASGGLAWALACATLFPLATAAAAACAVRRGRPGFRALRAALVLVVATALPLAVRTPWQMQAHRRLPAARPPVAQDLPDVVLVVLDTTRADRLSAYGHDRPTTPRLEQLARAATLYRDAVSPAVWTLPGHASIFTGLYPSEHRADHTRPLAPDAVTLAEWFRASGYRTGAFASNQMFREDAAWGLTQGFETAWCEMPVRSRLLVPRAAFWILRRLVPVVPAGIRATLVGRLRPFIPLLRETQPPAREVIGPALAWLDAVGDDAPRLLFVNLMEAHGMQRAHDCGAARFGDGRPYSPYQVSGFREVEKGDRDAAPDELARLRDWYDTSVACMDLHLGELIDGLQARGLLDDALLAVVADHGEMLGDQRAFGHRGEVWQGLVHVPLLLKLPGQREGSVCEVPTDTAALAAVLPALAGLPGIESVPPWAGEPGWVPGFVRSGRLGAQASAPARGPGPAPCPLPQRSEHPLSIAGPSIDAAHAAGGRYARSWIAVRDGALKLYETSDGTRLAADLGSPAGEVPLPPDPAQAELLEALLEAWHAEELRPQPGAAGGGPDSAEREAARQRVLRQLGYVGDEAQEAPR